MAFSNQSSCIITDSKSNMYNLLWANNNIELIFFDKLLGNVEKKTILRDCMEEFDTYINEEDIINIVFQKHNGNIKLLTNKNGVWGSEILVTESKTKAYNFNIVNYDNKVHIFYCLPYRENKRKYSLYHCYTEEGKWTINNLGSIIRKDVLNPMQTLIFNNEIVLGYFDLVDDVEQLFVKKYSLHDNKWSIGMQLTTNMNKKMYLDMISVKNDLYVSYSESFEGNLVIKYEKYDTMNNFKKLDERILSNSSNCSYPTLIVFDNKLWNVWTEYENVMSVYAEDTGLNWSEPYLWRESKHGIFVRYKFCTNEDKIKKAYKLNHSFGKIYPDIAFLGFGNLDKAVKVPLNSNIISHEQNKKKENIDTNDSYYDNFYDPFESVLKNISPVKGKK